MTTRRRSREIVLQLLYEDDINPERDAKYADEFLVRRLHGNKPLIRFGRDLLSGALTNRWEIDKKLGGLATNWSLRRMAAIDRNILRMATYEIWLGPTPGPVAINEAIELAKRFGGKQSGQFVNGILDRVLSSIEAEKSAAAEDKNETPGENGAADEAAAIK